MKRRKTEGETGRGGGGNSTLVIYRIASGLFWPDSEKVPDQRICKQIFFLIISVVSFNRNLFWILIWSRILTRLCRTFGSGTSTLYSILCTTPVCILKLRAALVSKNTVHISIAGHATTLPWRCDHMYYRPQNCWFMYYIYSTFLLTPGPSYFFGSLRSSIIRCRVVVVA